MSDTPPENADVAATITSVEVKHAPGAPERPERLVCTPPIDIYESDEGLVLIADLPGVSAHTLELQVQGNRLTLLGRVVAAVPPTAKLLHQEFADADFLRSFILSDDVNHEKIAAKLTNGVLEVLLPKTDKAPPRRIQVNAD